MSTWVIIGIVVFVLIWVWLIWEGLNSPIMPDNYDIRYTRRNAREGAPPTNEKSPPSSQTYSGPTMDMGMDILGFDKPKHWTYPTTDCLCMGKGGTKYRHTKDCSWKSEQIDYDSDYQKMRKEDQEWSEEVWNRKVDAQSEGIKRLHYLQTQLDELHSASDIAFDSGAQRESIRIQAEIDDLMGKSTKGHNRE